MIDIVLSEEQKKIVFSDDPEIYIKARAGTGKTTTLREFAHKRFNKTFLYLVYTNSSRVHAKRIFGGNTSVHTIHSLAWEQIGCEYAKKFQENFSIFEVNKYLKLNNLEKASDVVAILDNFFNSREEEIKGNGEIYELAKRYWKAMQDLSDVEALMTQDGQLKLFSLLHLDLRYDYVLIDEAQDLNPVAYSVIFDQKESKKVFVGDDRQAIFGYRNTINIFKEKESLYTLSTSFRFGEDIAKIANNILETFFPGEIIVKGAGFSVLGGYQVTEICRTNARLFSRAAEEAGKGKSIYVGGSVKEAFSEIKDALELSKGRLFKVSSPMIRKCLTLDGMKDIAKRSKNRDLWFLASVVEKNGDRVLDMMKLIERRSTRSIYADICFYTAHRSKGLEFDYVRLGDDFPTLVNDQNQVNRELSEQEINLIYVAVTRAVYGLELGSKLNELSMER